MGLDCETQRGMGGGGARSGRRQSQTAERACFIAMICQTFPIRKCSTMAVPHAAFCRFGVMKMHVWTLWRGVDDEGGPAMSEKKIVQNSENSAKHSPKTVEAELLLDSSSLNSSCGGLKTFSSSASLDTFFTIFVACDHQRQKKKTDRRRRRLDSLAVLRESLESLLFAPSPPSIILILHY